MESSVYDVIIPIAIGYLIISLLFALIATSVVYTISQQIKRKKRPLVKNKDNFSQGENIRPEFNYGHD